MAHFDRREKNRIRINQVILPQKRKSPKTILVFPAKGCLDLKEMLKSKVINKKTFVIAVEQHKETAKKIENFLKKHFDNYYMHNTVLVSLHLDKILKNRKIDLAFFDFCGFFNFEEQSWIYRNYESFKKNASIAFTFKTVDRFDRKDTKESVTQKRYIRFLKGVIDDKLNYTVNNLSRGLWGGKVHDSRKNVIKRIKFYITELFVAFDKKDFDVNSVLTYKDGEEMVFISLTLTGAKTSTKSLFQAAKKMFFNKVGLVTQNKTRVALREKQIYPYQKKRSKLKGTKRQPNPAIKTARDIGNKLEIYGNYDKVADLPRGKFSWIKIYSNLAGLNHEKVKKTIDKQLAA